MTMTLAPIVRDDYSAPFFDAAAEGRLMLRYSPSSGEWSDPNALVCSVTQVADLQWRAASGRGQVVTWTIKPGRPNGDEPGQDSVIAVVEMAEGPWLTLLLPDADPERLAEGASVTVEFVQPEGSEFLPVGRLA